MAKWYDSDEFLLKRLMADDEKALEYLFRQYYASLLRVSYRIVGSTDLGRDVIQEVFATLWEKRHQLNITRPVKAYLFRSVINRSLNYMRDNPGARAASLESMQPEQHATSFSETSNKLEEQELSRFIEGVVKNLPPQCKVAFQLSRNEEMSNKEIAEFMGISVKAVEKHISKALRKLRKSLESYLKSLLLFNW